jgi:hypothetical protein
LGPQEELHGSVDDINAAMDNAGQASKYVRSGRVRAREQGSALSSPSLSEALLPQLINQGRLQHPSNR